MLTKNITWIEDKNQFETILGFDSLSISYNAMEPQINPVTIYHG